MDPGWRTPSLPKLRELIAAALAGAVRDVRDSWRTPVLATFSAAAGPRARTVVLREADLARRRLTAWTDPRAPKTGELGADPRAEWCFHDGVRRMQLRVSTEVRVHQGDAVAEAAWAQVPAGNLMNYRSAKPPGTVIGPESPDATAADARGPTHFAVLSATVTEFDWLWLGDAVHRRARFRWDGIGWDEAWLVP